MEDLSVAELYAGLREPSFREQRVTLLQLLANKFTDEITTTTTTTDEIPLREIISYCLALISSAFGNQASTQREVLAHFSLSVLTNMTSTEANQKMMIEIIMNETKPSSTHWISILQTFLNHDPTKEKKIIEGSVPDTSDSDYWIKEDFLHLTSYVLCNLSQHEEIRTQMTRRSSGYIPKLLNQVKSQNTSRRHGAVGALRK